MKFTLGLCAILAIFGLGQAHQFPDFGSGLLHEDLQDILDLVPFEKIVDVFVEYVLYDDEVQDFIKELDTNPTVIKGLLEDFQAIPEVIKLFEYLQKEGIRIYQGVNSINKALGIKKLAPPRSRAYSMVQRTGGLRGFLIDIKQHIDYDVFISIYVDKLKTSPAFANFIDQLKSDNFQQIVNKVCEIKAYQFIVSYLEVKSVNLKIVGDIFYLVLGINVPGLPSKTLMEELVDFFTLIPVEEYLDTIIKYVNEDEKVQNALLFMFTPEFHDLLRRLEALKEHDAIVIYLEKAGLPVIEAIQTLHQAIGMEKYVPPKIENFVKSLTKTQKIGEGMKGLLKDLYNLLPLDEIDALFETKLKHSKVFVNFITKIRSKEMGKIVNDLIAHETYKEFITKSKEQGLDIEGSTYLSNRMIGLKTAELY